MLRHLINVVHFQSVADKLRHGINLKSFTSSPGELDFWLISIMKIHTMFELLPSISLFLIEYKINVWVVKLDVI